MDRKLLSLLGLLITMLVSRCQGQTATCHPHCNCTVPNDVTCDDINRIPMELPDVVEYLTLSNNFIGPILLKFQVDQLSAFPITELYLANNRLDVIEDEAFSQLTQLQVLDISNNNIEVLTKDTFAGLTNLKYLYANNAGIVQIDPRTFAPMPNILEIDLEGNRLPSVGEEFGSLIKLTELLLAQNQISEISPGAFAGLTALNHLSLFGNRLQKPLDSWFRTIIQNNGNLELDYRINSTIGREPNNWLCCPDVSLYYFFVGEQDKSLFSYPQLDVICTWPVPVSGRPISTLTMEELTMTPCSKYTATTTFANSPDERSQTSTVGEVALANPDGSNFLSGLNDVGAFFILLLFVVIGGCLVLGFSYWYKNKQGKQRLANFKNRLLRSTKVDKKKSLELTRKPYRQETSTYGSSDPVKRPLGPPPPRPARPQRPAPVAPVSPPSGIKGGRPIYTMDTDYSEEEIWSKT